MAAVEAGEPFIVEDFGSQNALGRIGIQHAIDELFGAKFETFKHITAALLGPLPDGFTRTEDLLTIQLTA